MTPAKGTLPKLSQKKRVNNSTGQKMEILVFRTGVENTEHIDHIAPRLNSIKGIHRWSFDLNDRDKILRIEAAGISPRSIEQTLAGMNYYCEELED